MIANCKTKHVITLHLDGTVCVFDALNLSKLYSFKNDGSFFMDLAISPNLYASKVNQYREYLLIALMNSLLIKPIPLKPCRMNKRNEVDCCRVCCCCCYCWSGKCMLYFISIVVLLVAVFIGFMQQQHGYMYMSTFFND